MSLDISYEIRTTDLNRIQKCFAALAKWAENTGRNFKYYEEKGFVYDEKHETYKKNGNIERWDSIDFHEKDNFYPPMYFREIYPTKLIGFDLSLKSGHVLSLGFMKVKAKERIMHGDPVHVLDNGGYYCRDFFQLMGPSGRDAGEMIKEVIEIDAVLEFIQENFFPWPEMRIHDETDFHKLPLSQVDTSQKDWWKELMGPEYHGENYFKIHAKQKNHDIKNILTSMGSMMKTFGAIEGMMKKSGWTDENIAKEVALPGIKRKTTREVSTYLLGDRAIQTQKDEIKGIRTQINRPRVIDLNAPGPKSPVRVIGFRRKK